MQPPKRSALGAIYKTGGKNRRPCLDGTFSDAPGRGACTKHRGLAANAGKPRKAAIRRKAKVVAPAPAPAAAMVQKAAPAETSSFDYGEYQSYIDELEELVKAAPEVNKMKAEIRLATEKQRIKRHFEEWQRAKRDNEASPITLAQDLKKISDAKDALEYRLKSAKSAILKARSGFDRSAPASKENKPPIIYEVTGKALRPATYKQYLYLESFPNVKLEVNQSQFVKRFERSAASEAIDAAKAGENVIIRY